MNDSVGSKATWGNERKKKRPSYATELWCRQRARGRRRAIAVRELERRPCGVRRRKKKKTNQLQNTVGKRQEVELSRSGFTDPTRLTILFWQLLPIGDRWVITKTKQYSSTQLTPKCSGTVMLVECWKPKYKTKNSFRIKITLLRSVTCGAQLCNTASNSIVILLFYLWHSAGKVSLSIRSCTICPGEGIPDLSSIEFLSIG